MEAAAAAGAGAGGAAGGAAAAGAATGHESERGPVHRPGARPGKANYLIWRVLFELDVKYTPVKPIGKGAYGVVCSARNEETGENVAIKKISNAFDNVTDSRRTLREIKLLRHLRHENIIALRDILRPAALSEFNDVYLVYELMDTDLHQIIRSNQPLSDEHTQYFIYQVLRGLKFIHSAGVLHRDLKPSNLLLNANCDLKICDFGLARTSADKGLMTEYVVTRWYRAPELLLSCDEYSSSIDMWSLGCVFAELLGRKPLFPGKDYINQLKLIIDVRATARPPRGGQVLGTQQEADIRFISSSKARAWIRALPETRKVPLAELYPKCNPAALDLLDRMLVFDPNKRVRISVADALAHPYMSSLHDPAAEPVALAPFVFDFEDEELKEDQLRGRVWSEVLKFHGLAQ